nr:nodulation protein NfeD [Anaerolineae bacterium]
MNFNKQNHRRRLPAVVLWFVLVVLMGACPPATIAQKNEPTIIILEATGPVAPSFGSYIARGLEEADAINAEAVVLMLDTPGGNLGITLNIVQDIRNSDVPVIVFVGPRGAKAGSAGLLITLAGHAAAMAPDTAIGASSPIDSQGQDLPTTAEEKAEQYTGAQARSLAERRGEEAVRIAEEAVFEARAVTPSEALDANLIDFVVEDISELLHRLDGFEVEVNGRLRSLHTEGASLVTIPMSQIEQFLLFFFDPNVTFLLLNIGILALIVEIRSPGGWVAGVVGVTCVGFALYGLGVMPVNWLGIVFVVMAFVLFILEIKAATHGALVAAGIVSLAVGGVILFNQPGIEPFGSLSLPLVIGQSLLVGVLFAFILTFAIRAQSLTPTTGYEGMVGQVGRVTQDLDPVGRVLVAGERWRSISADRTPIAKDSQVKVIDAAQMRLVVTPFDESKPEDQAS